MKKNLVLLIFCALGLTTMAQNPLVSVDHSVFTDDASLLDLYGFGVPTAYPAGHTTYRVYGYLDDANSVMQSVIGVPGGLEAYIGTDEPDGYLWNYPAPIGQTTGAALPQGFIPFGGDGGTGMYDSYVTIGSENSDWSGGVNQGAGSQGLLTFGIGVSNVTAADYWGSVPYADALNPDFIMTNEAWLLGDVTSINALGVGPSFQVLLAQLTTTAADIHYGLNVTALTDVPLAGGDTWITYHDASGLGGTTFNEADGTTMGLLYPAPPPGCIGTEVNLTVGGGVFDSEITWELYDAGGFLVASGGAPYDSAVDNGGPFCLADGCYEMVMLDAFGDGWNGAIYDFIETTGGTSVFSGDLNNNDLGDGQSLGSDFLDFGGAGACPVYGCIDTTACNFDSTATDDNGSCEFVSCAGCTDSLACNYDSLATIDDGSCAPDAPNDLCAAAIDVSGGATLAVNTVCAVVDEAASEGSGVWYSFSTAADAVISIETTDLGSGSYDTNLELFDGCPGDGGVSIAFNDDDGLGLLSLLSFNCGDLAAGTYWILVDGFGGATGATDLVVSIDETACLSGCTVSSACNYDSTAILDDGTCCFDNCVTLVVGGGTFDSEISWDLTDAGGGIVASGGAPFDGTLCLTAGCYSFNMIDAFGDGWNGATYDFGALGSGDLDGAVIGDGISFGTDFIDVGATGTCPVFGCTDSTACNYDSTATDDDGSCASDNDQPDCSTVAVPVSDPGNCSAIAVDLTGATNSLFSVNSGAERWYSFVAVSSVASIQFTNVNAPAEDAILGLYDDTFAFITAEDGTVGNFLDEIMNVEGLTVGNTYYVAVEEWNTEPSNMTGDLCIVQYPDSGCDLPPSLAAGPFTIQSQLKADYNALAAGYVLTMTSTTTGLSYSSPMQTGTWIYIVYSGAPNVPDNYDATLSAVYNVVNGGGFAETLTAGSSCNVDVGQFDTYLVAAHNCSNKTWSLSGRPKAAPPQVDAASFTWEFTQTAPVPGTAWEYTTPTGARKLPAGGLGAIVGDDAVSVIDAGATYNVRIRANYNSGSATDFGPTDCLQVAGASGGEAANGPSDTDGTFAEAAKSIEDLYGETLTIYPNPSSGDYFNLSISEVNDNKVLVNIVDLQGRTVQSVQLSADIDAPFSQQISLDNLSSGNYMVNVTVGGSVTSTQLVVVR